MSRLPPRVATRLLERVLPGGAPGLSIIGDLREEWAGKPDGTARDAWYVIEALRIALRYAAAGAARSAAHVFAGLGQDLGQAFRRLSRTPLHLTLTVLALGLGVAAPATMFTIGAGITRDLDVPEPDRLIQIGRTGDSDAVPAEWLRPLQDGVEELEAIGLFTSANFDLSGGGEAPQRIRGTLATAGVFKALRVDAFLGRVLTETDQAPAAEPVVVLSWNVWRERFGGDMAVVGQTVRIDGVPRTVVGVMPERFHFRYDSNAWIPLQMEHAEGAPAAVEAIGRLAPGATVELLVARTAALTDALRAAGEEIPAAEGLRAQLWRYRMIAREARVMLVAMVALVSFVLLIACADVANLMVARALARRRDTAVRVAMGAGRWRVVRQHLAEGLLLATLGGVLGLGLAAAAVSVFERQSVGFVGYWMVFDLDLPVLFFSAVLVLTAALITGLLPALQAGRVDVLPALQEGGRGGSGYRIGRMSRALVVGEVALSCALLVVAGLMVRGAIANLRTDGDYDTRDLLTARFELRAPTYTPDQVDVFQRALVEDLAGRPGIGQVALTSHLPGIFSLYRQFELDGERYDRPEDRPETHVVFVSPGFFETMGARVVAGRDFTWRDGSDDPLAVIVNEEFSRRWLSGRDPTGLRIRLSAEAPWATVVGVAPPLGISVGNDNDGAGIYLPLTAMTQRRLAIVARAADGADPLALIPEVRAAVARRDTELPVYEVATLAYHVRQTRVAEAIFAILFLCFGITGLVLASVGLYGILSFNVGQRTRELGVRVALGASPWRVVWAAVRGGALQLALGLLAGTLFALAAAPVLGEALLNADPRDPIVYVSVALVLGMAGLLAALMPARRALGVNVVQSLRD